MIITAIGILVMLGMATILRQRKRISEEPAVPDTLNGVKLAVKKKIEELIFAAAENTAAGDALEKREGLRIHLRQALRRCSQGSEGDRIYVREYIREILTEQLQLGERELNGLIRFEEPEKMSAQDKFEILLYQYMETYGCYGFEQLCVENGLEQEKESEDGGYYEISASDIRRVWRECSRGLEYLEKLDIVVQRVYQELYGYSVCDQFISADTALDSVAAGCGGGAAYDGRRSRGIMEYEVIYCMLHGKKLRMSFLRFASEQELEGIVKKLARNHPKEQLSRKNCCLVSNLLNNARVVLTRPPVSEGWSFYVRKFNSSPAGSLEMLLTDQNASLVISLLRILIRGGQNLVITGEQASGKTTLLKSLVRFLDPKYSIRVAESTFETRLGELYPERNIHTLQEYGDSTLGDAIALFKKTDTDVTICGEINEPGTAQEYVQLSQSGGRQTLCTSHHNTTEKLIAYMRNALLQCAGFQNEEAAARQAAQAVSFDVHMELDQYGHRYISRINEIIVEEEKIYRVVEILSFVQGSYKLMEQLSREKSMEIRHRYHGWEQEKASCFLAGGGE